MPWITQARCDVCGALRQQANHWWTARRADDGAVLIIAALPERGQNDPDVSIACGEKCLHAVLAQFIAAESRKG